TGYNELFNLYERRGWHITPVDLDQPIPDSRRLDESLWSNKSSMVGIDLNTGRQFELLQHFQSNFKSEYDRIPDWSPDPCRFHFGQTSFCSVDAEILYCMVRHFKPRKMIESGCGMSTTSKFKEWSTLFLRSPRMAWSGRRGSENLNGWIRNEILLNGGQGINTMRGISSRN